jgi:hypothetical protein
VLAHFGVNSKILSGSLTDLIALVGFCTSSTQPFDWNPKWAGTLMLGIFHGILIEPPPPKSKYQSWYLIPCCGLEVQNPTKAIKSVKDPDNIFELTPKWASTVPSVGNFSCDIYRVPPPTW